MCFNQNTWQQIHHVCEECLSQMQLQNLKYVVWCSKIESQSSSRLELPLPGPQNLTHPKNALKSLWGCLFWHTGTKSNGTSLQRGCSHGQIYRVFRLFHVGTKYQSGSSDVPSASVTCVAMSVAIRCTLHRCRWNYQSGRTPPFIDSVPCRPWENAADRSHFKNLRIEREK